MNQKKRTPMKGLLVAQFFGAFNDNAWKLMVTFVGIRMATKGLMPSDSTYQAVVQSKTTIAFAALSIPLILFSLPAGLIADRISKRSLIIAFKVFELGVMAAALLALAFTPDHFSFLVLLLALMGVHSAMFSPAKYGILSQLLPAQELTDGNSRLELWTFLAIILGTGVGGVLLQLSPDRPWIGAAVLCVFSAIGFFAALQIPRVPAVSVGGTFASTLVQAYHAVRADGLLWLCVLVSALFWFIASMLGQNVLVYSKSVLELSDNLSGLPLAIFGIGLGAGSMWASRLSNDKIEMGLVPLGAIGLSGLTFMFSVLNPALTMVFVLMVLLGVASALMVIPLQAMLQWRAPAEIRGGVIALSNVVVFTGTFLGTLTSGGLAQVGLNTQAIFIVAALIVAVGMLWTIRQFPECLLRMVLVVFTTIFYRLRVQGETRIPSEGGVLLTPSRHASFTDVIFLIASVHRPIRFVVETEYLKKSLLNPFIKSLGAIPVPSEGGNASNTVRAFQLAGEYLDRGEIVCVFPEGRAPRTGGTPLQPTPGLEHIIKDRDCAVVPVHLDHVFSPDGGPFIPKWPTRIPYPVTVAFGDPLPSASADSSRPAL